MQRSRKLAEIISDVREQVRYFNELGVDRIATQIVQKTEVADVERPKSDTKFNETLPVISPRNLSAKPVKKFESRLESLPTLSDRMTLKPKLTIAAQTDENASKSVADQSPIMAPAPPDSEFSEVVASLSSDETLDSIRSNIGDCTRCQLHALGRTKIVHSTGNATADLMFVGEAPGADEDEQGLPFVGRAGQLLTKIIESIGLRREEVFIGNINRCRPPANRAPEPSETAACRPFILREIAVVRPKVIVVLGATAAHNLLQVKTPISKLRGNFHDYFGVKVMPTFHPAYLLRDPHKKREVWEDMKMVREFLNK